MHAHYPTTREMQTLKADIANYPGTDLLGAEDWMAADRQLLAGDAIEAIRARVIGWAKDYHHEWACDCEEAAREMANDLDW